MTQYVSLKKLFFARANIFTGEHSVIGPGLWVHTPGLGQESTTRRTSGQPKWEAPTLCRFPGLQQLSLRLSGVVSSTSPHIISTTTALLKNNTPGQPAQPTLPESNARSTDHFVLVPEASRPPHHVHKCQSPTRSQRHQYVGAASDATKRQPSRGPQRCPTFLADYPARHPSAGD
jgi:hypothetical protein